MDAAHGVGEPPPELKLNWMCEKWGNLPDSGPPLEQDFVLMHRMSVYSRVYNVVYKWNHLEGKAIHSLTNSERSMLKWLQNLGFMFNG